MKQGQMAYWLRWTFVAAIGIGAIILPFFLFHSVFEELVARLLFGGETNVLLCLLIVAFLTADILLPVPSSIVSTASGALFGFVGGTIISWAGMTLGCIVGYYIGSAGGRAVVGRFVGPDELARVLPVAQRFGLATLVAARAVPVLAEATVIAAGAARLPLMRFFAATGLANLGISAAYAAIGAYAFQTSSFLLAVVGATLIPAAAICLGRVVKGVSR